MAVRIDKRIVGFEVLRPGSGVADASAAAARVAGGEVVQMHERLERPEVLAGATYKIKSPLFEHALYVTINDIVLNPGTPHEQRRPFEIFINSKNMDHFQWIVALTRIISAVFRKGGDVTFLVEEMKAVFDPRGGYFRPGGRYMPSIVAEIGAVIEEHLKAIGLLKDPEPSPERERLIREKRKALARRAPRRDADLATAGEEQGPEPEGSPYPASATLCRRCQTKAVVVLEGCATCLHCGDSKCG